MEEINKNKYIIELNLRIIKKSKIKKQFWR